MTEEDEENLRRYRRLCIPEEVRVKYFPPTYIKDTYDVLPLSVLDNYHKKIMGEVSILENPIYAKEWEDFMDRYPSSAAELKPITLDDNKVPIFANCRRQKVPIEYLTAYIGPPTSESIFRKTK